MKLFGKKKLANGDRKYYYFGVPLLSKKKSRSAVRTYFLGFRISKKQRVCHIQTADIKFENLLKPNAKKSQKNEKIDIVIPIYNGYEYLDGLFQSIIKNTDSNYRIIAVHDCSTDKRVLPLLKKYKKIFSGKMLLLENRENLGFIKSVNFGLSKSKNHVILLNTDTILTSGWAARLMYPILKNPKKIGSVTPFSNSATIFSLPEFGKNNLYFDDVNKISSRLSALNMDAILFLDFPTGHGFCMAMNKHAIKKVGVLDPIFGKGYGEENDWCMRARQAGFVNTLAFDTFVRHFDGGSFGPEKQKLVENNLKILNGRWPEYGKLVNDMFNNKTYLTLRFAAVALYLNLAAARTKIVFDLSRGGGTETYFFNTLKEERANTLTFRIQQNYGQFKISMYYQDIELAVNVNDLYDFSHLFFAMKINEISINHIIDFIDRSAVLDLICLIKEKTGAPVVFLGHDYFSFCPMVSLFSNGQACHLPDDIAECVKKCGNKCKKEVGDIVQWRKRMSKFLKTIDKLVVFSNCSKAYFLKAFPFLKSKIKVVPHKVPEIRKVKTKPGKTINLAVIGSIGENKGLHILEEIDRLIAGKKDINLIVIGVVRHGSKFKNAIITGPYGSANELPDIIEKHKINMVLIPSIWSETFNYTSSEAMQMGLPVACFNLGAQAEKVSKYDKGIIINEISGAAALNAIKKFMQK